MHVLPRWAGDTSSVTTTGETRVVPEALETTWEKLSAAFRAG
jgi:ATP adenylyltransferase